MAARGWTGGSTRAWRKRRMTILQRDRWTCRLCEQPIDPTLPMRHPRAATVHHVKGKEYGDDEVSAHRQCGLQLNPPRAKQPAEEVARKQVAATRAWRAAHPERVREVAKAWQAANSESLRESKAKWRAANPDVQRKHRASYRAKKAMAFVEHVEIAVLAERDGDRCGICQKRVRVADRGLDHILPLSHGGEHSYANTRLTHLVCNTTRRDRGEAQLRLVS